MYYGAVAVSVADIEASLHVSHGVFGALLASALFVGGVSSALISVRVHRRGVGATLRETLLAWAALLMVAAFVPTNWLLIVVFIATVGAAGAVAVVINTLATDAVNGKATGLLRVHATYNFGAAIGCAFAGFAVANAMDWRWAWVAVSACALLLAFFDWTQFDAAANDTESSVPLHASVHALVTEKLVLVAIAFVLGAIVEGGIDAWGPLYLRVNLDAGAAHGATATAVGYLIGCASRLAMSTLSTRFGAKWCVLLGTAVSCFGLVLITTAPSTLVAAIGLALAVGGITANWPLLISYATQNSDNTALITGGMSTAGYAGLVMSPAILGVVGNLLGLRSSLITLAFCAAVVMLLVSLLPRHRHS
jgi:MFS family permease